MNSERSYIHHDLFTQIIGKLLALKMLREQSFILNEGPNCFMGCSFVSWKKKSNRGTFFNLSLNSSQFAAKIQPTSGRLLQGRSSRNSPSFHDDNNEGLARTALYPLMAALHPQIKTCQHLLATDPCHLGNKMSDELTAVFQIMISGDKEWPGYKDPDDDNASVPILIAEIYRLIPFIGETYVEFHAKNMPDVRVRKVEIIGLITSKTMLLKYTSHTVDDGTSAITVLCPTNKLIRVVEDDSSDNECAGSSTSPAKIPKLKPPFGLAPEAPYSYEKHIETLRSRSNNDRMMVSVLEVYDYTHIIGYCCMTFRNFNDINKLTKADLETGRLFIYATHMRRLSETQHNTMLKSLITDIAKKRYEQPKN